MTCHIRSLSASGHAEFLQTGDLRQAQRHRPTHPLVNSVSVKGGWRVSGRSACSQGAKPQNNVVSAARAAYHSEHRTPQKVVGGTGMPTVSNHHRLDQRSLALRGVVADAIRRNPAVIERADQLRQSNPFTGLLSAMEP